MKNFGLVLAVLWGFSFTTNAQMMPNIVGGTSAKQGEFSFIVSLQSDRYKHMCGGSLIADNWVLTAAHCVQEEKDLDGYIVKVNSVVIGMYNQKILAGTEKIVPLKIYTHPKFNAKTMDYDYALIQLSQNSSFTPISLNTSELVYSTLSPIMFTVIGWGATKQASVKLPDILQKVDVPLVPSTICNAPVAYNGRITDRMLCAGYQAGKKDGCQGDSGGPLVMTKTDGTRVLAGIVSWGIGCAQKNKYGIYEKVNLGMNWIRATTGLF